VKAPAARADVRAYACPITFVKTRIALDRLDAGEVLEVWLAAGEPVQSVPRSAEEEGHRVLAVEPLEAGAFRVLIEKGTEARAPGASTSAAGGEPWP
jgi:tRNA 2-thiouridine synthesizing protein A